jgi:serine/threonine-protein kinase
MVERAREILGSVGFNATPLDWDWGLIPDVDYLNYADDHAGVSGDDLAARGQRFWYRQAPVLLERLFIVHPDLIPTTAWGDPPLYFSGEVRLALDPVGRLVSLEAMSSERPGVAGPAPDMDWTPLFRAAGLDPAAWIPDPPQWSPWFFADRRVAWIPRTPGADALQRVEAGSAQGKPVGFQLIYPWTMPSRDLASRRSLSERTGNLVSVLILTSVIIMSALIARKNLRLDRADRRGAARLAAFVAAALFIVWLIDEHHVPSIWELYLFVLAVGWALFVAALLGTFYLALEPYVRRTWPATIMSWSRVMAGNLRDPLVARDTLIGVAFGGATSVVNIAGCLVVNAFSGHLPRLLTSPRPYFGAVHALSELASTLVVSIFLALVFLFILFVMRRVLRWEWAAIAGGALLLSLPSAFGGASHLVGLPFIVTIQALTFVMLARVGLVATIVALFTTSLVYVFPLSIPPTGWTAGVGPIGVVAVAVLAAVAFRISTADARKGRAPDMAR